MKAVIYTRGQNREQQINECKEYAKRFEIEVIGIESEWNGVEQYVYNMKTDFVIVYDVSRITRKADEYISIVNKLSKFDVKIIAVN